MFGSPLQPAGLMMVPMPLPNTQEDHGLQSQHQIIGSSASQAHQIIGSSASQVQQIIGSSASQAHQILGTSPQGHQIVGQSSQGHQIVGSSQGQQIIINSGTAYCPPTSTPGIYVVSSGASVVPSTSVSNGIQHPRQRVPPLPKKRHRVASVL